MRGVWFWPVACAALLGAPRAAAAPFVVDWHAPDCAQESAFRARVRDALQREPELALEQELSVDVTIREAGERPAFRLKISVGGGARELELPSCAEAVAAAATLVALTIDPQAHLPAAEPEPSLVAAPVPRTPEPRSAPAAEPVTPAPSRERFVAAFAGVSLGDVPASSPLVGGRFGLRLRSFALALDGFWLAQQTELLPGSSKGGEIGLWGGGLAGCYGVPQGLLRLSACVGAQAGAWHSRGVGVVAATEQSDWWLAGVARVGAGVQVAPSLGLFLNGDVVVPARRPWFRLEGVGAVFRPPAVAFRPTAGVELSF